MNRKHVRVDVWAYPGTGGKAVTWGLGPAASTGSDDHFPSQTEPRMRFRKNTGTHKIEFALRDKTTLGLKFAEDKDQAIWVTKEDKCPPPGPGDGDGQIIIQSVEEKLLKIKNRNSGAPCVLRYALNFTQRDGTPEQFDPIVENGGGIDDGGGFHGGQGFSPFFQAIAGIAAIVGLGVLAGKIAEKLQGKHGR